MSLYVVSALFGLFQGGIVPAYAIIVREYFPPREAGVRVGIVLMATLFGMALGGWMSGAIFDLTGSYRAAFINGIGWNLLNLTIALWLLRRASSLARPSALLFHSSHGRSSVPRFAAVERLPSSSLRNSIGPSSCVGLELQARVHLGVDRAEHGLGNAVADHGHAVAAHQHAVALPKRAGQRLPQADGRG